MMKFKLMLAFVALSQCGFSQDSKITKPCNPQPEAVSLQGITDSNIPESHPYGGTFQIISKKGTKEIFTNDIVQLVESKRQEDKEVVLVLSPNTKIKIPSKKEISSSSYRPFVNLYTFE